MTFQADSQDCSPTGVAIARDFRDNLIIDRFDPVFADMRASKLKHLRSANSEDAVTWNVFRSLRQVAPRFWVSALWARAFPDREVPADIISTAATVTLWKSVEPPIGLLASGDEGPTEADVVIECATWVWFIEAKYKSDISLGTTTRPDRDQVLRNIDVGSFYAGVRRFYFSLLTISDERSPHGAQRIQAYIDLDGVRERLSSHRPDGLTNIAAVGSLVWRDLGTVLEIASGATSRADEREYARRALAWLREKKIIPSDG